MKVIVTGANGFVGSHLVNLFISRGIEVMALDLSFNNTKIVDSPLVKKVELSIDNVQELNKLVKNGEYDLFYHLAWAGSAGPLRTDKDLQTKNVMWTVDCLKVADAIGCKKFICAGSIMEYEMMYNTYVNDGDSINNNIYGAAKSYAHAICKYIAPELKIDLVWGYITNAYGVGEISPRFINTTIRKIIKGEELNFTSGEQNYDFLYIDDVAEAFYLLGLYGKNNKGYMIGSGNAKPLKEFIIEMCEVLKSKNKPQFGVIKSKSINLDINTYSIKPLIEDCNFAPKVSFADGIKLTREWLEKVDNEH